MTMLLFSLSLASAADVSFAGSDTDGGNRWLTATEPKPLDADGDDIYGTAGYIVRGGGQFFQVIPPDMSVHLLGQTYNGDSRQSAIDSPDGGTMIAGMISMSAQHHATFTFTEPTRVRVGVFTDNYEFFAGRTNAPSSLIMSRVGGGSASTADPIDDSVLEQTDGHFFDLQAEPGDEFRLTAPSPTFGNELAFMTFDVLPPTEREEGFDAARSTYDLLVGGDPVSRSGPSRLRPEALTALVDDLVDAMDTAGCTVSDLEFFGGAHASGTGLGEVAGEPMSATFSGGGFTVDSPWSGEGRHNRQGHLFGTRDDGGFIVGRWVRVTGRNGLWMGMTGSGCDDPTIDAQALFRDWRSAP